MRVLVADDDPISRRLLQSTLNRWGYEVEMWEDGEQAWQALQGEDPPKLAILDWMMPGMSGIDICRQAREGLDHYTYILLVTTKGERADMVAALEAGADDYLPKPFDPAELQVRVRGGTRILDLQERLLEVQAALRKQATHDALTGLWNRAAILEFLDREVARTRRNQKPLALIVVDFDHFKRVNDTHGHRAGDLVLSRTSQTMQEALRSYDGIGRYGGEEFLIVMPGCDLEAATERSERIRSLIAAQEIDTGELKIRITASLGVAELTAVEPPDAEQLMRAADRALYRAKELGRNRVEAAELDGLDPHPG